MISCQRQTLCPLLPPSFLWRIVLMGNDNLKQNNHFFLFTTKRHFQSTTLTTTVGNGNNCTVVYTRKRQSRVLKNYSSRNSREYMVTVKHKTENAALTVFGVSGSMVTSGKCETFKTMNDFKYAGMSNAKFHKYIHNNQKAISCVLVC